ncbi:MAG: hypothetical protein IIW40_03720 [Clostridia bacterium]|nr:hypothetical protein [Clostridia bacterium]
MKRFFLFLLVSFLLLCLAGCGDMAPDPVSSAPSTTTSAVTTATASAATTTTSSTTTTTDKPTNHAEILRLTVLTPHLTAKTDSEEDGSRYLISMNVADYAPGTILKVTYDGRIMMSYPAQIVAQSIHDTGETDKALTLIKGKIVDGSPEEGYGFQADEGGERICFTNRVQGLLIGTQGTLCLYDYGDQDVTFEGYFYADK